MSIPGTGEEIRYDIIIDMRAALDSLQQMMAQTTSNAEKIQQFTTIVQTNAKEWGVSFAQALAQWQQFGAALSGNRQAGLFGQTGGQDLIPQVQQYQQSLVDAGRATTQLGDETETQTSRMTLAYNAVKTALRVLIAMLVFEFVQQVRMTFEEAIKAVESFEVAIYNAKNAVNILREAGVNISFKELTQAVDVLHDKFLGMFPTVQLQDAISDTAIRLKDFGVTAKQISDIVSASATIALRTPGETLQSVSDKVLTALSTGRTQALDRLGTSINELSIKQYAYANGLAKEGTELDKNTKFMVTYLMLTESMSKESGTLAERQNTLEGATRTLNASWATFLQNFGTLLAPTIISFDKALTELLDNANKGFKEFKTQLESIAIVFSATAAFFREIQSAGGGITGMVFGLGRAWEAFNDTLKSSADYYRQLNSAADSAIGSVKGVGDAANISKGDLDSLIQSVVNLAENLAKLAREYAERIQDILQQYANKVSDAGRKYRESEENAEAKYQEAMRQLREKYLFDLEDALRNRDARQVLRLQQQFKMQQEALTNNYKLEDRQRKQEYEDQLRDAKRAMQQQLAAAAQNYADQKADLLQSWDDKLRIEAHKLAEQLGLNSTQEEQIYQLLKSYYGPQGKMDGLYSYSSQSLTGFAADILAQITALVEQANATLNSFPWEGGFSPIPGGNTPVPKPTPKYPHPYTPIPGGTQSLPRGRLGTSPSTIANSSAGFEGTITLEMLLSPDLEARIVNNTLDETARIVTKIGRSK